MGVRRSQSLQVLRLAPTYLRVANTTCTPWRSWTPTCANCQTAIVVYLHITAGITAASRRIHCAEGKNNNRIFKKTYFCLCLPGKMNSPSTYTCFHKAYTQFPWPVPPTFIKKTKTFSFSYRLHYRHLALSMLGLNSGLFGYGQALNLKLLLKKENMKKLQQVQDCLASLLLICLHFVVITQRCL